MVIIETKLNGYCYYLTIKASFAEYNPGHTCLKIYRGIVCYSR